MPKKTKKKTVQMNPTRRTKSELKVLDAAITLFARHGYGDINVREIAEEAGVTKMTLYRGFENKDVLFDQVLEEVVKRSFDPSQFLRVLYDDKTGDTHKPWLQSALKRWYSSLPVSSAKLLIHALLCHRDDWRSSAMTALDNLVSVVTTAIHRHFPGKESQNRVAPNTVAKAVVLMLLQVKILSPEAHTTSNKRQKQEDADVDLLLDYCLSGIDG